jgi:hypothetical protein
MKMKERVSVRLGRKNVIFVAPHAHDLDDVNTGVIAMTAAACLDAHAIVNNGWKRSVSVDEIKGLANCNDLNHCLAPVVKAEFTDPIMSAVETITADAINDAVNDADDSDIGIYVFMIHGVGDGVRKTANDPALDLIVGFGNGTKPYFTCDEWRRDCFMDICSVPPFSWKAYAGAAGGAYSARSKTNMTQAIHRETGHNVLQLEFVHSKRCYNHEATTTGKDLAKIIEALLKFQQYTRTSLPNPPEI